MPVDFQLNEKTHTEEDLADPRIDRGRWRHDRGDAGSCGRPGLETLRRQDKVVQSLRAEGQEGGQPVHGEGKSLRRQEVTKTVRLRISFSDVARSDGGEGGHPNDAVSGHLSF
jgi:hypothetical protein